MTAASDKYGRTYILKTVSPGCVGTVAMISGFLAGLKCYIAEMNQFDDYQSGLFFSRTVFRTGPEEEPPLERIQALFRERIGSQPMKWSLHDPTVPVPTIILVSRADHCLLSLLYRQRLGELNMDIRAIVSNHRELEETAAMHDIPFHHLPVSADNKVEQENRLMDLIESTGTELIVLARYMQILSDRFCTRHYGRAINIHHSFLPGFKGARPYQKAFERGVKLIGATAHYVTSDLDEGPIIEQVVERVDNPYAPGDLVSVGRDMESLTLSRAVRLHLERRVCINGHKTIVFR